ncbi:hypothetical protein, partial [Streptomyces sp. NPDC008139]|uniref:hypothetical protein n=1 Tax=Streptomyces sp. NPDC008139 TaxID=3364814 RepID=UPI0036EB86A3
SKAAGSAGRHAGGAVLFDVDGTLMDTVYLHTPMTGDRAGVRVASRRGRGKFPALGRPSHVSIM